MSINHAQQYHVALRIRTLSYVVHKALVHLQRSKHHAAAVPAASDSSQMSSSTQLHHTHSNAASDRDADEVSSRAPHPRAAALGSVGDHALQPLHSNAAAEQEAVMIQGALPMQVGWTCLLLFLLRGPYADAHGELCMAGMLSHTCTIMLKGSFASSAIFMLVICT